MSSPRHPYEAALMRALKEEETARHELGAIRRKLVHQKAHVAELACAVDSLIALLSEDQRNFYRDQLSRFRPTVKDRHGTTLFEKIVAKINEWPEMEWSAANIYNLLYDDGIILEIEQVHNTLNYLARKGRLLRTSRGKYVLAGQKKTAGTVVQTTPAA